MFGEAKISVPLGVLNLRYKLYVRKHVLYIISHNIPHFDDVTHESNSVSGDDHAHKVIEVDIVVYHVEVVDDFSESVLILS